MDNEIKGTIKLYKKKAFFGELDLTHGRVIGMAEHVMDLFLNAPPNHFIGTFLYFYHVAPEQENPITISAWGNSITTHPGQGRLLGSYFRKDKTITSLLVPLHQTQEEIDILDSVSFNMSPVSEKIFEYDNQNHHGISTEQFKRYFHPTSVRLDYEAEKDSLVETLLTTNGTIGWTFPNRDSIRLGDKRPKINIQCEDAEGFYHSVFYLAFNHFKESKKFKIL